MDLPILELESQLLQELRESNRLILEAPTGSGKSTQTPKMLLRGGMLEKGEAIVLQPRRIAARMLARRVAEELSEPLGKTVGYQVRHESSVSRDTRIRFVTEGILLRRMISDPELKGVSCIVFDEFHERSLHADMTLARALMLQKTKRPDLKLIVMSATLNAASLEEYLAPCSIVKSEGRVFPVCIRYLSSKLANVQRPVWDLAAEQVLHAVAEEREGHVLVFMPGAFEIGRTIQALGSRLSARDFEILPLHSELSAVAQDKAVEGGDRRKVIVATNVAETSLTIDNVRVVVDSGQARIARYDPVRGVNTLWIEKISDASASQRSGRAGRTAPGIAIRLWSERDHASRSLFEVPEVSRVDLSEMLLSLLATGIEKVDTFEWFEVPEENRLSDAVSLLGGLGAIDEEGRLTKRGKLMSGFPLHPRYAAMLIAARDYGCVEEVATATAIAQSRSLFIRKVDKQVVKRRESILGEKSPSDLLAMVHAWEAAFREKFDLRFCHEFGIHAQSCRQVGKIANQLYQYAEASGLVEPGHRSEASESMVRKCILIGFPDRVCKRLDRGTLRCSMVGGRRGDLSRESLIGSEPLFVACEANEIGRQRGEVNMVFNLCTAIEREWLEELFPDEFSKVVETVFSEKQKRVVGIRAVRFRDLDIESFESLDSDLDLAAEVLAGMIKEGKAKLDKWDESVEALIRKVDFLSSVYPEYEISRMDEDARSLLVEQCCHGARSLRDLKKVLVLPILEDWIGPETRALVGRLLPDRLKLANGRPANLRVEKDGQLTLSAKIQSLYDLDDTPTFCDGRVRPRIELLAPNMRPIQMTDDLKSFWTGSYEGIKKELKGRYPKHEWR